MLRCIILFSTVILLSSCELSAFGNADAAKKISYTDVTVYWSVPVQRVNGDNITISDIAGYEIRYKEENDEDYSYLVITSGSQDQALLSDIIEGGNYTYEVAAIDNYGIYSAYTVAAQ